jgi:hypothetical protein
MTESDKKPHTGNAKHVSLDKSADILEAMFKQYFKLAMDHLTKATSTSNILLIIVGALITLVGFDKNVCGAVDAAAAIGVIIIAVFGGSWTWKQLERYHHWEHIAHKYQEELAKIVPMLKTERVYRPGAEEAAAKGFSTVFARTIQVRYLWVALYSLIAVFGLWLLYRSMMTPCP